MLEASSRFKASHHTHIHKGQAFELVFKQRDLHRGLAYDSLQHTISRLYRQASSMPIIRDQGTCPVTDRSHQASKIFRANRLLLASLIAM